MVSGPTSPYTVVLTLGGNPVGNQAGPGPFTFSNLSCGDYQVTVTATSPPTPSCTSTISITVDKSLGNIQIVRITGGPCNIDKQLSLSEASGFRVYSSSEDPIPKGIPTVLQATKGKYTVFISLIAPYTKFTKVFGADQETTISPQIFEIFEGEFPVYNLPLTLGETKLSE